MFVGLWQTPSNQFDTFMTNPTLGLVIVQHSSTYHLIARISPKKLPLCLAFLNILYVFVV
jgi:hypothetical protein